MRRSFRVGICAAVLMAVTALACIAQGQGQGLGSNANRPSWIADSQDEFDMKLGLFVRAGDFGSVLAMSQIQPWWTKAHPELYAAVHSPSGAAGSGGGGGGGRGPSQGQPLVITGIRLVGQSVTFDVAWLPGHPLPGDALDVFGTPGIAAPAWEHLWREPLPPGALATNAHTFTVTLPGPVGWGETGFFQVADLTDTDGDGIPDAWERLIYGTDPNAFSSAGDGMSDGWKIKYGLDPSVWLDPDDDPDGDGLTNLEEYLNDTNPFNWDTDGDGVSDFDEVAQGSDPNDPSDLGLPPSDIVNVNFEIYARDAAWDLTVQGTGSGGPPSRSGPGDLRAQRIRMPSLTLLNGINPYAGTTLKLRGGNSYRLSMRWLYTDPREFSRFGIERFDWALHVDGLPSGYTYPDFTPVRIPGIAETVWHPNWVAENQSGLMTSCTLFTDDKGGGGGNVGQTLVSTLHVLKFTFVTPAGNPVTEPQDAGDGQNQFTYSTNSVGTLTLNLQARVEPAVVAAMIADRCEFRVDAISGSAMQWHPATPNGRPVASSDGTLSATVTFTGLPSQNTAFGWKTATLRYYYQTVATNQYGVFFPKDAKNHPSTGMIEESQSNWFYYWKKGGVCGIPATCEYDMRENQGLGYLEYKNGVPTTIVLCPGAANSNSVYTFNVRTDAPLLPAINYPPITFGSLGKGILSVAEVVQHETIHYKNWLQYRSTPVLVAQYPDGDNDKVPDALEITGFMGVMTATNHPDTYQLARLGLDYTTYGDEDIRCRLNQATLEFPIFPEKDWANPGCQHKNQWGPKVGQ